MRSFQLSLLLSIVVFAAGCDLMDTSNARMHAHFEIDDTVYREGESIRASFVNASGCPLYVVRESCSYTGIEKLEDEAWRSIFYSPAGTACTAGISFTLVPAGDVIPIAIPPEYLAKIVDSAVGTYRFRWSISPDREYANVADLPSDQFRVER